MIILTILTLFFGGLLFYFTSSRITCKYTFWSKKNVKGPTPIPIFGNMWKFVRGKMPLGLLMQEYYKQFPNEKAIGIYKGNQPVLLLRDVDLVKQVLMADFDYFDDRGEKPHTYLGDNLFTTDGPTWRVLKQSFSPIFTPAKMKNMFYLVTECGTRLEAYVNKLVEENTEVEIRDLGAKFTMESIGSCAFGLKIDSLNNGDNVYREIGKKIFTIAAQNIFPYTKSFFGKNNADEEVTKFFKDMVKHLVEERQGKPKLRHDFMDLLIEMKEKGQIIEKNKKGEVTVLDIDERIMASQAFIFFAGGFETSAGTISFMLYELAKNQKIQDKARKEIDEIIKQHGSITYEAILEMHYLEMVMSETLRKYPMLDVITRRCNATYKFSNPDVTLEKGDLVFIPAYAIHNDPELFPEPEVFDPERFSRERKNHKISLSFGEGPRYCIGERFAKMQDLLCVAVLIRNFTIHPSSKTKDEIKFKPSAVVLTSNDGIWVNLKKRNF